MQCLEHVTASGRALHVRAESEPRHFAAPSLLSTTSSATIRYRALTLISVHGENISGCKKKHASTMATDLAQGGPFDIYATFKEFLQDDQVCISRALARPRSGGLLP